jgi:hypothetical protein
MIIGPKRRDRRQSSYDESTDEPAPLIEKETTDVEQEKPSDDTEPVEEVVDQEDIAPPAFEE